METLTVLIADPAGVRLPTGGGTRLRATRSIAAACDARRLLVFASATALPSVAECVSRAARGHRLHGLFVRNDIGSGWVTQIFERAALRRIRNSVVHDDPAVGARILSASALGAEGHLIADATVAGERLLVMDCAFRVHEIGFDAYPVLARIPPELRGAFRVDADGAYLHWPDFDADLDMESVRLATDPGAREAARRSRVRDDRAFGAAARQMREERGVRQSDVPGLSERQVRRIETGAPVTTGAVDALAGAHGMDVDEFLEEIARRIATIPEARAGANRAGGSGERS